MDRLTALQIISDLQARANVSAESLAEFARWADSRDEEALEVEALRELIAQLRAELVAARRAA